MTARDRRALVAGAVVLVLAVLLLRVGPWILGTRAELLARIQQRAAHLARVKAELATLGTLEDSARVLRGEFVALAPLLVPGTTAPDARAALAAMVRATLTRDDVLIQRLSVGTDTTAGLLQPLVAKVELLTDAPGLEALLLRLGHGDTVLEVTGLRVVAQRHDEASPDAERLSVALELRAWGLAPRDTMVGAT